MANHHFRPPYTSPTRGEKRTASRRASARSRLRLGTQFARLRLADKERTENGIALRIRARGGASWAAFPGGAWERGKVVVGGVFREPPAPHSGQRITPPHF